MDKKNIISVKNLKYKNIFDGLDLLNNFLRQGYSTNTLHTGE